MDLLASLAKVHACIRAVDEIGFRLGESPAARPMECVFLSFDFIWQSNLHYTTLHYTTLHYTALWDAAISSQKGDGFERETVAQKREVDSSRVDRGNESLLAADQILALSAPWLSNSRRIS